MTWQIPEGIPVKKNAVPNGVPTPGGEIRTVRERTLARMENLLRSATKSGAGIALAASL